MIPRNRANSQNNWRSALNYERENSWSNECIACEEMAGAIDSQWMSFVHFYCRKICVKIYRDDSWWPGTRNQIIKSLEMYRFNGISIFTLTRQSVNPFRRFLMDFWQNQWFMRDFGNMYAVRYTPFNSGWLLYAKRLKKVRQFRTHDARKTKVKLNLEDLRWREHEESCLSANISCAHQQQKTRYTLNACALGFPLAINIKRAISVTFVILQQYITFSRR